MTVSTLLQHETLGKPDHYGTYAPSRLAPEGLPVVLAGQRLIHFDDFKRSDRQLAWQLADGEQSPSGVRYKLSGQVAANVAKPMLASGRLVWTPTDYQAANGGGDSPMQLVAALDEVLSAAACEVIFNKSAAGSPTLRCSAVLGCAAISFAQSSIQFAIWPDHWQLFWTQTGFTNQVLASGNWTIDYDQRHTMVMRHDPPASAVHLYFDGAFLATVANANVNAHWGKVLVIQQRRDFTTDDTVNFCSLAAAAA